MKKSKSKGFTIALLLTAGLLGCEEDDSFSKTRVIENQTPFNVTIEVFDEGAVVQNLAIEANELSAVTTECWFFISKEQCSLGVDWTNFSDSVVVKFDNSRKINYCTIYQECYISNVKNITYLLDPNSYQFSEKKKKSDIKSRTYTFLLTMDDFNAAIPISN